MWHLGKSKPVNAQLTQLRNFAGLLISMFLQLSHCFRKPITYWKSKTILIICHPFLTPSQREKCPYYPAFGLRVQMRENEDRITSNTDTFLVVPINSLTDKKTWWESSTNFFNFFFSIVKQGRSSIFT